MTQDTSPMPQAKGAAPQFPDNAIEIDGLTKVYNGGKTALSDINLTIRRGSFFGLLGPNGAGKSSLINTLAGLVRKTSGRVSIWGNDLDREERNARCAIGVVPQELNLDPFFTPREALEVQAGMYGVPPAERRTEEILDAVGLLDKADAYSRTLSGGMRRRLLVAKAMVHTPPILVLDEPTAGVDIELRQQLWSYVRGLNAMGTTVVLTTHYLEEAQQLCDEIAIINEGKVVACEPTRTLLRRLDSKSMSIEVTGHLDALPPALAALGAEIRDSHHLVLTYRPSDTPVDRILDAVRTSGLTISDLSTEETDLEDIFLQLTSKSRANAPTP